MSNNEPINPNGLHQASRDVLLGHALQGVLAGHHITTNSVQNERIATKAARLAIEAVDELIRLDNENANPK